MVVDTFPSFRDETVYDGTKVYLWKRPQILVAETWAAFFPASQGDRHPIFPGEQGPTIASLKSSTISESCHIRPLSLNNSDKAFISQWDVEELSLRTSSIIAVDRVRAEILAAIQEEDPDNSHVLGSTISSVLIDFFLWDLAKRLESGEESIEGLETEDIVPIHRTRSIWY
ncbi:hypothetical protein CC2G_012998 [Coprinopsis cinerea AmutBmut pab1-1]|nr:hypothetical protein CC2G_012998 [Coprinopsis cinerea AmutBmut pab1-1]